MKNAYDWHVAAEVPDNDEVYYDGVGVVPDGPACDECDSPCPVVWTGIEWIPTIEWQEPHGAWHQFCSERCLREWQARFDARRVIDREWPAEMAHGQ